MLKNKPDRTPYSFPSQKHDDTIDAYIAAYRFICKEGKEPRYMKVARAVFKFCHDVSERVALFALAPVMGCLYGIRCAYRQIKERFEN